MSGEAAPRRSPLTLSRKNDGYAAVRSSPLPSGEGPYAATALHCSAIAFAMPGKNRDRSFQRSGEGDM